jgi:lipoprotein
VRHRSRGSLGGFAILFGACPRFREGLGGALGSGWFLAVLPRFSTDSAHLFGVLAGHCELLTRMILHGGALRRFLGRVFAGGGSIETRGRGILLGLIRSIGFHVLALRE